MLKIRVRCIFDKNNFISFFCGFLRYQHFVQGQRDREGWEEDTPLAFRIIYQISPTLEENYVKFTSISGENCLTFSLIFKANYLKFSLILTENCLNFCLISGENCFRYPLFLEKFFRLCFGFGSKLFRFFSNVTENYTNFSILEKGLKFSSISAENCLKLSFIFGKHCLILLQF